MATRASTMSGKVCIVTGATSGIGLATARELARLGATTVIVARDPDKGAAAVASIQRETNSNAVELMLADLSAQAQVRRLAEEFKSRHARLDVLVNNVGAFFFRRQISCDGIEMTFAVNYLNVFLLTNLLLDSLRVSAPARVVNVASEGHRNAELNLDDLQSERKYSGMGAYGQAKLALVLFTYELARRTDPATVTVNALHPGFVATNIGQNNGWLFRLLTPVLKLVAISPEEGAQTSIYLASSPEVVGVTGQYFEEKKPVASSPLSYDEATASSLWEMSAEMTGL
jgi:NAD(P)-dependent dehydrogenase (short-subunit alcohol dehydrogenase family)